MTKRLNNQSVYHVATSNKDYSVILERLKNGYCGNPRFKAYIVDNFNAYIYTFNGHYLSEQEEAKHIVKYHLDNTNK